MKFVLLRITPLNPEFFMPLALTFLLCRWFMNFENMLKGPGAKSKLTFTRRNHHFTLHNGKIIKNIWFFNFTF